MAYPPFFSLQKTETNSYNVRLDSEHPLFKAHFPNFPILPGSCTSNIIRAAAESELGFPLKIVHVTQMKFVKPIFPNGDIYNLTLSITGKEDVWVVKATISSANQPHCKAQLSFSRSGEELQTTTDAQPDIAKEVRSYLKENKIALLIPTYNNDQTIASVVKEASTYCDDVIVVNDGSTDKTSTLLSEFSSQIHLIDYMPNKGKGHALKKGFEKAKDLRLEAVITLDSDGQHKLTDLPLFVDAHRKEPEAMIIGSRSFDNPNMPSKNSFANRFSNFWFTLQTGLNLPDTQTGYRLYPLKKIGFITPFNQRYEAELELLVRCAWKLVPFRSININVYYPPKEERISHFRPGKDFLRISLLNTALCILAVVYGYPSMLIRNILKKIK